MTYDLSKVREYGQKISGIDLDSVKQRLVERENWTPAQADEIEAKYRVFLLLIALNPSESLSPTVAVDEMWHAHILDTRKYITDCESVLGQGRYIHHNPNAPRGVSIAATFNKTQEKSRELVAMCLGTGNDGDMPWLRQERSSPPSRVFFKQAICQGGGADCDFAGITEKGSSKMSSDPICQGGAADCDFAGITAQGAMRVASDPICQGGAADCDFAGVTRAQASKARAVLSLT